MKCWGQMILANLATAPTADSDTPVDVIGLSSGVVGWLRR